MQELKNKRRFILLAVLTTATLFAFWWIQPENRLDVDTDIFHVADLNVISKVEMVSDTGTVTISYNGSRWRVNERYDADDNMVSVLFATLQQARPRREVAGIRKDSIFRELSASGVTVSLFEGAELRKRFIAGGNPSKTQALFADPDTGKVYVVTIPGYRVYVSGILELDERSWRNKFVFGFNWRNFKSLEATFPKKPSENFTVAMDRNHFGIQGLPEADTAKLNTFLDDVSLLTVDEFISEPGLRDSLRNVTPEMSMLIRDIGNRTYRLQLFNSNETTLVSGILQDSQPVIFDRRKIQRLLKPKSFFNKK